MGNQPIKEKKAMDEMTRTDRWTRNGLLLASAAFSFWILYKIFF